MGIPGARSPPVAPRCRVQHRAWWHSGTSEGGLQQGDPRGTPVPHMADVPVPGTPPALLPWGLVAVPSVSAPHLCSPAEGLVMGGGLGLGGTPGVLGGHGAVPAPPPHSAPLPSRCCDKKSCGNRNETPSDPVIIDRYGAAPGGPRGARAGSPCAGGGGCERCLVSANDLRAAPRSLLPLLCCLCNWHCGTGSCPGPWGTRGSPPSTGHCLRVAPNEAAPRLHPDACSSSTVWPHGPSPLRPHVPRPHIPVSPRPRVPPPGCGGSQP